MIDGVNRRRGQRPKGGGKDLLVMEERLVRAFLVILVVLFVLVATGWVDLEERGDSGLPYHSKKKKQTAVPPGTSLVECRIVTPSAETAAAANGVISISVRHDLSPIHSQNFIDLVEGGWFDGVFIFRVLKEFVAQWGLRHAEIAAHPLAMDKPPNKKDVVHDQTLSNVRGTLSFAGGNPATQQVFVNLGNNARLDKENSRPFATVDDVSMTTILDKLYTGYKDGQGQAKALHKGVDTVRQEFPLMSMVESCKVVVGVTARVVGD